MTLKPGNYYLSRDHQLWCCYKLFKTQWYGTPRVDRIRACCVRVRNGDIVLFDYDGRYSQSSGNINDLVDEVDPSKHYEVCEDII